MSVTVLDVEQHLLLLELQAPFDKRDVQLARRKMAKRWHPDLAPSGRQFEHERHLKAINQAADQLERLAEGSRGGRVSSSAVRASAAAARRKREEEGRRAYEAEQRARASAQERARHDPFASRVPDHSVVHRYARCLAYPEWGVGSVTGIYFSADPDGGDDVQQWARVRFSHGVRIYEQIGAIDLAEEAAERAAERGPADAGAWERLGRLRLRLLDREGALEALERASRLSVSDDLHELLAQALAMEPRAAPVA